MDKTFFAYHLTHEFGDFGLESYHTNSTNTTEGDLLYVISGDRANDGGVDYSLEGIFRIYRRHIGPWKLKSLKGEAKDFLYRLSLTSVRMPSAPIEMKGADWYDRQEIHQYFSSGQNFNPLPPTYKERFDELLTRFGVDGAGELAADLDDIAHRDLTPTDRQTLALARVGQGKFRSDVMRLWGKGEVCALTGIDLPEMLIASHIKPWRDSDDRERLDPANGLLLAAHVDKLFDRYLLSFRAEGGDLVAAVHPRARSVAAQTNIDSHRILAASRIGFSDHARLLVYMRGHYERHRVLVEESVPTA